MGNTAILIQQVNQRARKREYAGALKYCLEAFEVYSRTSDGRFLSLFLPTAGLFAELGDTAGFHQWCDALINLPQTTEHFYSRSMASMAILTLPPRPEYLEWVRKQIPEIQKHIPKRWERSVFLLQGLMEYRASNYQSAIEFLLSSEATQDRDFPEANRLTVLAMAHHKLNQTDRARDFLKQAQELIAQLSPQSTAAGNQELESGNWHRRLLAQAFLREAEALMGGPK